MTTFREYRVPIIVGATLAAGLLLLVASHSQWHFRPSEDLGQEVLDTLRILGHKALAGNDVPVAAVILYAGEIIGEGRNTVQQDRSAGGHAEIEAISDAFKRIGFDRFGSLDRDSLVMVSTFEPCLMCRGAMLEYNIKRTVFLKGKPVLLWLREDLRTLRYYWARKQGGPPSLQDSLFQKHPLYPQEN
ncbi:MAG TPA: nucleoside deaminase [Bacteroidota bacterium]|nr:nucleoside deaminase [Bacteroidota bacterium]